MSKQEKDGGPAFPVRACVGHVTGQNEEPLYETFPGMTLRDYFAAKAMQGILSNAEYLASANRLGIAHDQFTRDLTRVSFSYADAMLEARKGRAEV